MSQILVDDTAIQCILILAIVQYVRTFPISYNVLSINIDCRDRLMGLKCSNSTGLLQCKLNGSGISENAVLWIIQILIANISMYLKRKYLSLTSCHVPFSDENVVPLQFPCLSTKPATVTDDNVVSLIFKPVIIPPFEHRALPNSMLISDGGSHGFYSVNVNQSTIVLYSNDNYITLSHIDLHRLKQLQHCIDLYIVEKQKKLESYQKTFDTAYALIKSDVNGLPSSCQRNEFTNQYIQNYDFSYSNIQSEDCSFMYELLQFHFNSLSNMILQDLVMFYEIHCYYITSNPINTLSAAFSKQGSKHKPGCVSHLLQ
ncbi:hypothetical protein AGLY_001766 [Aphis glycines]|uniref:Uncharacterized protein n=1 Tax=Aphis glycines TaxID=307491 RepID=A0A6G0U547_APHGL|nr:hypothetical protein AGLY_001766 [Aphis glycines]